MFALKGSATPAWHCPYRAAVGKYDRSQGGGEYALPWAEMQWPFRPKIQKSTTFSWYFAPYSAPNRKTLPQRIDFAILVGCSFHGAMMRCFDRNAFLPTVVRRNSPSVFSSVLLKPSARSRILR